MIVLDEAPTRTKAAAQKNRRAAQERFLKARKAEKLYARQLRNVAKQVGKIVSIMAPKGEVRNMGQLHSVLSRYSDMLRPWAHAVAERLLEDVARRDAMAWAEQGREIGQNLAAEIQNAPIGPIFKKLMEEQVELITSLPRKAAQRVQKLVIEAMGSGTRAKSTAVEIMRTGEVTESRAMLIARTETSRAATATTEARAKFIGSEGYIWRTANDADVRPLHKKLRGKFIRWDSPPVAGENGEHAHAGAIYNCRCYPEPVIPDDL